MVCRVTFGQGRERAAIDGGPIRCLGKLGKQESCMEAEMNRPFAALFALTFLALVSLAAPVYAQTAAVASRPTPAGPFSYDITRETALTGTVSSVVQKPS